MTDCIVSQLFYYPIKSAAGINTSELIMDAPGPRFDRRWMVVDQKGNFLTQRQHAKMCLLQTDVSNGLLQLKKAGDQEWITIPEPSSQTREVLVWRDYVQAQDCGDMVAAWLSRFFGFETRLVFMPPTSIRPVNPEYANNLESVSFADAYPSLLANEASLADFNNSLENPIAMDRFRPNIVLSGAQPWAEDGWKSLKIGEVILTLVSPCSRCIVPSIDQQNGNKQHEVIEALNKVRRRNNETYFGINCLHKGASSIRVGDRVKILA